MLLSVMVAGSATAASGLINGNKFRKGSITSKQIKHGTLGLAKLKPAALRSLEGQNGPAGSSGPTGPPGQAGSDGSPGPAGPSGPPGESGPTGPTGPTGATGATGVANASGSLLSTSEPVAIDRGDVGTVARLQVPPGSYLVTVRVLVSGAPSPTSNGYPVEVDCQLLIDGHGQGVSESYVPARTSIPISFVAVLPNGGSRDVRATCLGLDARAYFSNAKVTAVSLG